MNVNGKILKNVLRLIFEAKMGKNRKTNFQKRFGSGGQIEKAVELYWKAE